MTNRSRDPPKKEKPPYQLGQADRSGQSINQNQLQ